MPGTITVRAALRTVSVLLGDFAPQFHRHAEADLVQFMNDGARAVVKFLPSAGARLDALKLRAGTAQTIGLIAAADCIPTHEAAPTAPVQGINLLRVVRNMGADGLTPGRALRVIDAKMLDAQDPDWHTATAKPVVTSYCYDPQVPRAFYVVPPVDATPVWVEVAYNAQPPTIPAGGAPGAELYLASGSNAAVIPLPDEYEDDLVNYTVARANMREVEWADAAKATFFANLFLTSLNGKVAALSGANPNLKRLPFAREPMGSAS